MNFSRRRTWLQANRLSARIQALANTIQGVTRYGILVFRTAHRKRKAVHQDRKAAVSGESEYQRIDVFDSEEFGKFISLDGEIVFSEKDEFIYDEMVTHVRWRSIRV